VGAGFAHGTQDSIGKVHEGAPAANPFFCPPKSCLYYSGDWDSTNSNSNGLWDFYNPPLAVGDVWVGVKPTRNALITGVSGNYFAPGANSIGINPTPFEVRTGTSSGHSGKLVCRTSGNATFSGYGQGRCFSSEEYCFNYYISKLKKSCRVEAGKIYYVDVTPRYVDNTTLGYLWDDDGVHANKRGWPEITNHSYFTSISFHANYEPTWPSNGACGGIGCSGFSISLTAKQQ
jgi:hypothetical protein